MRSATIQSSPYKDCSTMMFLSEHKLMYTVDKSAIWCAAITIKSQDNSTLQWEISPNVLPKLFIFASHQIRLKLNS